MYQVLALPSRKVRGNKGRLLYSSKMQSMKARLKSNRKVIVDVEWDKTAEDLLDRVLDGIYRDKNGNIYHVEELEFIEYYGG